LRLSRRAARPLRARPTPDDDKPDSLFESSTRLADRLTRRIRFELGVYALAYGMAVWVIFFLLASSLSLGLSYIGSPDSASSLLLRNPVSLVIFAAASIVLAGTAYAIGKRKWKELFGLKSQLNAVSRGHGAKGGGAEPSEEGMSVMEPYFFLADKLPGWMAESYRLKIGQAVTFGLGAFLLVMVVSWPSLGGITLAALTGFLVWLYFRYEGKSAYDHERRNAAARIEKLRLEQEGLVRNLYE